MIWETNLALYVRTERWTMRALTRKYPSPILLIQWYVDKPWYSITVTCAKYQNACHRHLNKLPWALTAYDRVTLGSHSGLDLCFSTPSNDFAERLQSFLFSTTPVTIWKPCRSNCYQKVRTTRRNNYASLVGEWAWHQHLKLLYVQVLSPPHSSPSPWTFATP